MQSVTVAFELMKLELEAAVEELNSEGAELFRESRYEEASNLTNRGTTLHEFCLRVEKLSAEWADQFAVDTISDETEQEQQTARTILSASKASKTRLLVVFPDGTKIAEASAAQTLAKVLERIGLEKIASLGILVNRENIVSSYPSKKYNETPIGRYFVKTHSSTNQKKKNLEEISSSLNLGLQIFVI